MSNHSQIRAARFRLMLKHPLKVGNRVLTDREGLVIRWMGADGRVGWGEVSPLPGYHRESLDDAVAGFRAWRQSGDDPPQLGSAPRVPSLRFGLEQASRGATFHSAPAGTIRLNALINLDAQRPTRLDERLEQGFTVFKIKVARGPLEQEIAAVLDLLTRVPAGVRFRFDANGGWSIDEAVQFARAIPREVVDYLEEPVADPAACRQVRDLTRWPIAADESLADAMPSIGLLAGLEALVCKPSRVGGLARAEAWCRVCREAGVRFVLSSAFESGLGLSALLDLTRHLDITEPCGFDTASEFAEDLLEPRLRLDRPEISWPIFPDGIVPIREHGLEWLHE